MVGIIRIFYSQKQKWQKETFNTSQWINCCGDLDTDVSLLFYAREFDTILSYFNVTIVTNTYIFFKILSVPKMDKTYSLRLLIFFKVTIFYSVHPKLLIVLIFLDTYIVSIMHLDVCYV